MRLERIDAVLFGEPDLRDHRREWEVRLVDRVKSGDQAAFRELVERYQRNVFAAIYRILRDREETEDIAQQVFTKVYFAIGGFDFRSSLFTWIRSIAVNECYSYLRRRRVKLVAGEDLPEPASGQPGADTTFARRDFLNKLLAQIPQRDRLLIIWKEMEGHSISELAEMTGLSESAIKIKLFRIRRKLVDAAKRMGKTEITRREPPPLVEAGQGSGC